jgi:hypothetical protein
VVERIEIAGHVFLKDHRETAFAVSLRPGGTRNQKRREVYRGSAEESGNEVRPEHCSPPPLAGHVGQQNENGDGGTDQALHQGGRREKREENRGSHESRMLSSLEVPGDGREGSRHVQHVGARNARPKDEHVGACQQRGRRQAGGAVESGFAEAIEAPERQQAGEHGWQAQSGLVQPAEDPSRADHQPVGEEGLVVVGIPEEIGMEIVTRVDHVSTDPRPPPFHGPQFRGSNPREEHHRSNRQQREDGGGIAPQPALERG